jgi:hypothetical protein
LHVKEKRFFSYELSLELFLTIMRDFSEIFKDFNYVMPFGFLKIRKTRQNESREGER